MFTIDPSILFRVSEVTGLATILATTLFIQRRIPAVY
jgi:hypothetical protein